ncbi:MAG TPA: glycosyltransferase family 2 protein [Tepidisphaeraceae bacterium]|nr:glycosyltransferase family 2 protein [Tepidisphaeraceae bacterium]
MLSVILSGLLAVALWTVAVLVLVPIFVLTVECLAAVLPRRVQAPPGPADRRPRSAVVIPAHNEQAHLGATLRSVIPQLGPADRLIVVADNCDDQTARVALSLGAEVMVRNDANHRGKGFAMDFAIRQLDQDAPPVVVFTDADCDLQEGALDALVRQVASTGRPAQATYLLGRPADAALRDTVSTFAFLLKNEVRPTGLRRMGLPCQLHGAGMALPWDVIRKISLADGNIVEDLQLGLNLASAGCAPLFCPAARVTGRLPSGTDAAITQRRRWEHGHLRTIFTQAPRLLKAALTHRSFAPLVLALDVAVPPLSLLALAVICISPLIILAAWFGAPRLPAVLVGAGVVLGFVSLLAAWAGFARRIVPFSTILAAPFYIAWKVPMYVAFLVRPQRQWVRTPRAAVHLEPAAATDRNR